MKRIFVMGKQIMLATVLFAGLTMTSCEDENVKPEPPAQHQQKPDNPTPDDPDNPTPDDPENPTPDNPSTPDKPSTPETPAATDVDLTADMYMQNGETVTCDFVLNEAATTVFGLGTPEKDKYADLTNYKTLVLEVTGDDSPRMFFNENDPERITVNSESKFWSVADDGKIVIDLAAMAEEYTYVHLNSIKASSYDKQVTIVSMKLTGGSATPAPEPEPEKPADPTPSEPAGATPTFSSNGWKDGKFVFEGENLDKVTAGMIVDYTIALAKDDAAGFSVSADGKVLTLATPQAGTFTFRFSAGDDVVFEEKVTIPEN